MKRIIVLAAAALLAVGAQAATGHHAPKAASAQALSKTAKAHKATSARHAGKKAVVHKHGAQKHAALKSSRKTGRKQA